MIDRAAPVKTSRMNWTSMMGFCVYRTRNQTYVAFAEDSRHRPTIGLTNSKMLIPYWKYPSRAANS